jgi:hypothetical protein
MKEKIINAACWIVFAFLIGMAAHFGFNTAKLIWPVPAIEIEVKQ